MSAKEAFWDYLCGLIPVWRALALVDVVILLLLSFSLPFLSPESGTFVVAILALLVVLVSLGFYGVVYHTCRGR